MHSRYPRAAVAAQETSSPSTLASQHRSPTDFISSPPGRVLWATHPLSVRAGRVVAVRLVGQFVEVALVSEGAGNLQWVVADNVLTGFQIEKWLRTSKFTS